jgi:hypothetical protein
MLVRTCSRCGKELDDAASREAGIGPVCRKLDNALLAKRIPADVHSALVCAGRLVGSTLDSGDTAATMERVRAALAAPDALTRDDWRLVVKQIEWLLSFPSRSDERDHLFDLVGALGYTTLVACWRGETSSGRPTLWIERTSRTWEYSRGPETEKGAFIFVTGPRNPTFNGKVKATGRARFHSLSASGKPAWSLPVSFASAMRAAVETSYIGAPKVEGFADLDALWAECAALTVAAPVAVPRAPATAPAAPPAAAPRADVKVTVAGAWLLVRAPYSEDLRSWVRALPYNDRKWSESLKCWQVRVEHREALDRVLTSIFPHHAAA